MIENYTVQDVLGILRVIPFFSLVLFIPGYLIGVATNVFDFRRSRVIERIPLAVVLSVAVSPYLINTLCRWFSVRSIAAVFLLLGFIFLANVLLEWKRNGFSFWHSSHWTTKAVLCLLAGWTLICLISLPDIQIGQRLYSTAAIYDHGVRSAFISSAMRNGSPPANPFFYAGSQVPARYYYYWNVLCAIPATTAGTTSRFTICASCFWSGLLFASIIPVYLKYFLNKQSRLRITSLIGIGLIAITGLDLIPIAILGMSANNVPLPDIEWWDPEQVTSWFDAFLWVPHHLASLVSCLAAFLFLWRAVDAIAIRDRIWLLSLAALGFSSAAGLSIYVTFTFALFMMTWTAYLALRRQGRAALMHFLVGCASVFLSLLYLHDLLGSKTGDSGHSGEHAFFAFSLRLLPIAINLKSHLARFSAYLALCVVFLFLELGVYFIVAIHQARHDWKHRKELSEAQKALWMMAATALAVMMFLRTTVLKSNDLGWRAGLILQFVLLLWTAIYLGDEVYKPLPGTQHGSPDRTLFHAALFCTIFLGGAGSIYQLWNLRTFTFFREKHGWSLPWRGAGLIATGTEALQIRSAYERLDRVLSPNAIVQINPENDLRIQTLNYSQYQQVDGMAPECAVSFGGSLADCLRVQAMLKTIFNPSSTPLLSKAQVVSVCNALGITVLVVTPHDPIWSTAESWMSQSTPIIQNDVVRMYRCDTTF